jgi:hypothetical protein
MDRRYVKVHRLTVRAVDGAVHVVCEAGDFDAALGEAPTPDRVSLTADGHWGKPLPMVGV